VSGNPNASVQSGGSHRATGGHVTHNPPHLDESDQIGLTEQMSGMGIESQDPNAAQISPYQQYYNQFYPQYPYGYSAYDYYAQSYYPQASMFYQQPASMYPAAHVLPTDVKYSAGLWVPPTDNNTNNNNTVPQANSTAGSNTNSDEQTAVAQASAQQAAPVTTSAAPETPVTVIQPVAAN
jgi:hypothetical protein